MDISLHTYTRVGHTMTGCETNMTWGQPALQEVDGITCSIVMRLIAIPSTPYYGAVAISTSNDQVQSHKLPVSRVPVSTF